jgi:cytoskeletal protein CcmA (bactofilin family)
MGKFSKSKVIYAAAVSMFLIVPFSIFAAQFKADKQVTISKDEVIHGNLYLAGSAVSVAGMIQGDLLAAGGNVTILGPVTQDVMVAGGTIIFDANVGGDVRIAGGNITIEGDITGDLVVAGGQIAILSGTTIRGDLVAAGGQVTNNGTVRGQTSIYLPKEKEQKKEFPAKLFAFFKLGWVLKMLMIIATGLVLFYLLRQGTQEVVRKARDNFGKELLRGFILLVTVPVAILIMLLTVVGVPIGVLGIWIYATLLTLSSVFGGMVLGSVIYRLVLRKTSPLTIGAVLIGIILFQLFKVIPFVGWFITFVFFLPALGSLAHVLYQQTIVKWRE